MRWVKVVLIFQAIVTLILGMVFFSQVLVLNIANVSELNVHVGATTPPGGEALKEINIKQRYAAAAYILLFISLIELIIIIRLFT